MESGTPTQPLSTLPGNSLPGLPTELLYMIRLSLPLASRIALALTCKKIRDNFGIEQLKGKNATKLLLLLEKDSPTKFVCFGCSKLRPLIRHLTRGWVDKGHKLCGDHRKRILTFLHETSEDQTWCHLRKVTKYTIRYNLHVWKPLRTGPKISFSEAHLVMNRHRYGPRHGISLDFLKQDFDIETFIRCWNHDHFSLCKDSPNGRYGLRPEEQGNVNHPTPAGPGNGQGLWSFGFKYSAMIVDDELHVVRLHRVSGLPVRRCRFLSVMYHLHLPICNHLAEQESWETENSINPWYILLNKALDSSVSNDIGEVFAGNLAGKYVDGSCGYCFTDYEILVKRDEDTWTLELVTYHRLGRCETPDDPIWQCLASPLKQISIGRERVDPSFGPGRTREKWYEALAGTTNTRGGGMF